MSIYIEQETPFAFGSFRGRQHEVVSALIDGMDVLALLPEADGPTCYQSAMFSLAGAILVIGSNEAAMRIEINQLKTRGVRVTSVRSIESRDYIRESIAAIAAASNRGEPCALYIDPCFLDNAQNVQFLQTCRLKLIALCNSQKVSTWSGEDDSDYLRVGQLRSALPAVPLLALAGPTNSATRDDIARRLQLKKPRIIAYGFDRANLCLHVENQWQATSKLVQFIRGRHKRSSGIIYCSEYAKAQELANWLKRCEFRAFPYGSPDPIVNELSLHKFKIEPNSILVTTVGFDLPEGKQDIRFVAHLAMPNSVEAYYGQISVGGLDGKPFDAWFAYNAYNALQLKQAAQNSAHLDRDLTSLNLEGLTTYCEGIACHKVTLLSYLGEQTTACGKCGICVDTVPRSESTLHARRALAAVYRTKQRFNVNHLIDILVGKRTDNVLRNEHDRLKSFRIGAGTNRKVWTSIFRHLIALGHLRADPSGSGIVALTASGVAVLRGEIRVYLRGKLEFNKPSRGQVRPIPSRFDPKRNQLLSALDERRTAIARAQKVKPQTIVSDYFMAEMAKHKPQCVADMMKIHGEIDAKRFRYADEFLELIAAFAS